MTEPIKDPSDDDVASWHRTFAPMAFNRAWELLQADLAEMSEE